MPSAFYKKTLFQEVRNNKLITHKHILQIQKTLEQNEAGYRRNAGTVLKNERTGEVVYTPPQDYTAIKQLMDNLVTFINDEQVSDLPPSLKWHLSIISSKLFTLFTMVMVEPEELLIFFIW